MAHGVYAVKFVDPEGDLCDSRQLTKFGGRPLLVLIAAALFLTRQLSFTCLSLWISAASANNHRTLLPDRRALIYIQQHCINYQE